MKDLLLKEKLMFKGIYSADKSSGIKRQQHFTTRHNSGCKKEVLTYFWRLPNGMESTGVMRILIIEIGIVAIIAGVFIFKIL
ncbi:hypothetical protein OK344_04690 [Kaistella sp. BT6-1-3]|uniref:Uncharacterized protein n=1 Tax=Kaistella yananensis TaxID=2989820 RepID=A0ABT3JL40_9FLAO|nr:hypothetical protein [Kaistella yananensis]MCW4451500.1 hypothetical protein [Kaistella yananensis]